jgi:dihydrofolate reductase
VRAGKEEERQMPPSVSLYISTTLDGYIARSDGAIDWLTRIDENDTDYGYEKFFASIDGLIMGSATFDFIRTLGPWPYGDKPSFIFTRRALNNDEQNISFVAGDPAQFLESEAVAPLSRLWLVGGSSLIAPFVRKDLIDEYIITVLPVVLGHGLRLFPSPAPEQWLEMTSCTTFNRGILQVQYCRNKTAG